jgi:phenylacetic acid degradation operon negative regulatory protein
MKQAEIMAEELLILLTYGLDLVLCPTFRNLDQSYEGWLYRNGLLRRVHWLEKQRWIAREQKRHGWVVRVTESGRDVAVGSRDPEARWERTWDGWWRQFVFDLPIHQQKLRVSLLRWLRRNGFGYLQDSVWITPDPVDKVAEALKGFRDDVESFTILECRCAKGFNNSALVTGAWPFEALGESYRAYIEFADATTKRLRKEQIHPREVFALLRKEREAWAKAFDADPLLPRALWPDGYGGPRAWRARQGLLRTLGQQLAPGDTVPHRRRRTIRMLHV